MGKAKKNRKHNERNAKRRQTHTTLEWLEMIRFFGGVCVACEGKNPSKIKLTKDHINPISKGGHNGLSNIQPLCDYCNNRNYLFIDYRKEFCRIHNIEFPIRWLDESPRAKPTNIPNPNSKKHIKRLEIRAKIKEKIQSDTKGWKKKGKHLLEGSYPQNGYPRCCQNQRLIKINEHDRICGYCGQFFHLVHGVLERERGIFG